mmetsp:Transcript_1316/g.3528  ORF Transcript_1316/g.3528 Transcript_1316/m.3528 type:complete len:212 (-) Transcript_1316:33-668(-)
MLRWWALFSLLVSIFIQNAGAISCHYGVVGVFNSSEDSNFCLRGRLSCKNISCSEADVIGTEKQRICKLQSLFCGGSTSGSVEAMWGSQETCPRGIMADAFGGPQSGMLTNVICCDTPYCNLNEPAPVARCIPATVKYTAGPCSDQRFHFKTCGVDLKFPNLNAQIMSYIGSYKMPWDIPSICMSSVTQLCSQFGTQVKNNWDFEFFLRFF